MDAEEIARLVKDLRVSGETSSKSVIISKEEVKVGQKKLEKVVVGKIFSRRVITREMMRSNLPRILRSRGSTEIERVGPNLFVISFSLESDKKVALEEGPWHFFQDLMVLKQSMAMQTPGEVEFDDVSFWVQCHNVPLECMEPTIVERIGAQIGKVEEVDVNEGGSCVGKFARVRVSRKIADPLVRFVSLKQEGMEKEITVIFQYEKLPDFCFLCGRVGHISRDCKEDSVDRDNPGYGSRLRAGKSYTGRRDGAGASRSGVNPSESGNSETRLVVRGPEDEVGVETFEGRGHIGYVADGLVTRGGDSETAGKGSEVHLSDDSDDLMEVGMETRVVVNEGMVEGEEGWAIEGAEVLTGVGRTGGEISGVGLKKKGKGKETFKPNSRPPTSGGGSWKRRAREKGGDSERAVTRDTVGDRVGGGCKRKGVVLRDEEAEEGDEGQKVKQAKVLAMGCETDSTAAVAEQPRRSL